MTKERPIFCCECATEVSAVLVSGKEIYPHRPDLFDLPFWQCRECKNFVGCHHKTTDRTRPLGNIPSKEIREARRHIHAILDPLWKNKKVTRHRIYEYLSKNLGYDYHTAEIISINDASTVCRLIMEFKKQYLTNNRAKVEL